VTARHGRGLDVRALIAAETTTAEPDVNSTDGDLLPIPIGDLRRA
jgi:hypothetical protein